MEFEINFFLNLPNKYSYYALVKSGNGTEIYTCVDWWLFREMTKDVKRNREFKSLRKCPCDCSPIEVLAQLSHLKQLVKNADRKKVIDSGIQTI